MTLIASFLPARTQTRPWRNCIESLKQRVFLASNYVEARKYFLRYTARLLLTGCHLRPSQEWGHYVDRDVCR